MTFSRFHFGRETNIFAISCYSFLLLFQINRIFLTTFPEEKKLNLVPSYIFATILTLVSLLTNIFISCLSVEFYTDSFG